MLADAATSQWRNNTLQQHYHQGSQVLGGSGVPCIPSIMECMAVAA